MIRWSLAIEGAVHTNSIVVASECVELAVKVDRIPEEGMVQILAADGSVGSPAIDESGTVGRDPC